MNITKTLLLVVLQLTVGYNNAQQKTDYNPMNIDYGYLPIPDFAKWGKHRIKMNEP